jgi:hypothetical protein
MKNLFSKIICPPVIKPSEGSQDRPIFCNHKYREFNWYCDSVYFQDTRSGSCKIYKPYVCIHCKHRKNILLHETKRVDISFEDFVKFFDKICKEHPKITHRTLVEEAIADSQLIDREYLKLAQECFPDREILLQYSR